MLHAGCEHVGPDQWLLLSAGGVQLALQPGNGHAAAAFQLLVVLCSQQSPHIADESQRGGSSTAGLTPFPHCVQGPHVLAQHTGLLNSTHTQACSFAARVHVS